MDIAVLARVLSSLATSVVAAGILYQGREAHEAKTGLSGVTDRRD